MTFEDWTSEERSAVLNFYGLESLSPTEWIDDAFADCTLTENSLALAASGGKSDLISGSSHLDTIRQGLRDEIDPLGIKEPSVLKSIINSKHLSSVASENLSQGSAAFGSQSMGGSNLSLTIQSQPSPDAAALSLLSNNFDPRLFLSRVHVDTHYEALLNGRKTLERSFKEKNETLKSIVKQNFDRFVNAKNSIEVVYRDMQQRKLTDSDHGMRKAIESISSAYTKVNDVYGPMISRREQEVKVRSKLEIFKKYEFIFCLCQRLESSIKLGEYQTAGVDFRRGKAMLQDAPNNKLGSVLRKVWDSNVEPVVEILRNSLKEKLADPILSFEVHCKLIQLLQTLESRPDPILSYFQIKKEGIFVQMRSALDSAIHQTKSIERSSCKLDPLVIYRMLENKHESKIKNVDFVLVKQWKIIMSFLHSIADILTKVLPDVAKFASFVASVRPQKGLKSDQAMSTKLMTTFSQEIHDIIIESISSILAAGPMTPKTIAGQALISLSYAVATVKSLLGITKGGRDVAFDIASFDANMTKLVQNMSSVLLTSGWGMAESEAEYMLEFEDYEWQGEGYEYASFLTKGFGASLIFMLEQTADAFDVLLSHQIQPLTKPSQVEAFLVRVISSYIGSLRKVVTSEASIKTSATEVSVAPFDNIGKAFKVSECTPHYKILSILININYLRRVVIHNVFKAFEDLQLGEVSQSGRDILINSLDTLETDAKEAYLSIKRNILFELVYLGTVNSGLDWNASRSLESVRPHVFAILLELSAIQTEISDLSTAIMRPLIHEFVVDIFEEFLRCLQMIRSFGPGSSIQIRAEIGFLQSKLSTIMSQEAFDIYNAIIDVLKLENESSSGVDKLITMLTKEADESSQLLFCSLQYN